MDASTNSICLDKHCLASRHQHQCQSNKLGNDDEEHYDSATSLGGLDYICLSFCMLTLVFINKIRLS